MEANPLPLPRDSFGAGRPVREAAVRTVPGIQRDAALELLTSAMRAPTGVPSRREEPLRRALQSTEGREVRWRASQPALQLQWQPWNIAASGTSCAVPPAGPAPRCHTAATSVRLALRKVGRMRLPENSDRGNRTNTRGSITRRAFMQAHRLDRRDDGAHLRLQHRSQCARRRSIDARKSPLRALSGDL